MVQAELQLVGFLGEDVSLDRLVICQCLCGMCVFAMQPPFWLSFADSMKAAGLAVSEATPQPASRGLFLRHLQSFYHYKAPRMVWGFCRTSSFVGDLRHCTQEYAMSHLLLMLEMASGD